MKKIGFLINPIAGMGGRVGLKGSDGPGTVEKALKLGALPSSNERAWETKKNVKEGGDWLTCGKTMGEDILKRRGFQSVREVYEPPSRTSAEDTKKACKRFLEEGVELVIFCGGDGTARDVLSVVEKRVPILGIPAGVKMQSGVFGTTPLKTADLINRFISEEVPLREVEVMDIDEDKYRNGELDVKLFGYALCPYIRDLIQGRKCVFQGEDEEASKEEIANYMAELLEPDTLYLLGAGSTIKAVMRRLGVEGSILGVDAIKEGNLLRKDLNEKEILAMIEDQDDVKIVISPIGAQGYIFGRGNQQFSPEVLRRVGVENLMILATPMKLRETPVLRVDTGEPELDKELRGLKKVISGYHGMHMKMVE